MNRALPVVVALAALAAGCARKEAPSPQPPARPVSPSVVAPESEIGGPRNYVTVASSIDRMIVRASELAQTRARDPRLRAFAQQLAKDHLSISAQLSFAGRRLNQLPTGRLLDNHSARLAALESSADFDAAYMREMSSSLSAALEYHSRYARRGESPTLRPVARYAAQVIDKNLRALRPLR